MALDSEARLETPATSSLLAEIAAEHAPAGIALLDSQGSTVWQNPAFVKIAQEEPRFVDQLRKQLLNGEFSVGSGPCNYSYSQGHWQVMWSSVADPSCEAELTLLMLLPVPGDDGDPAAARNSHAALDALTGVLNRQALQSELEQWVACSHENPFALVFLDLDNFKSVNDRYGHLVGDACLEQVGERIRTSLRAGDVVGRFGGDEFVLLLAQLCHDHDLAPVLDRVRSQIEGDYVTPEGKQRLGVSMGWAYSSPGVGPKQLLSAADRAMYAAKRDDPPSQAQQ